MTGEVEAAGYVRQRWLGLAWLEGSDRRDEGCELYKAVVAWLGLAFFAFKYKINKANEHTNIRV